MPRRDAIAAVALIALGAAGLHQAARLPFGVVRNPGPGFVPWWLSVALAGLALVLLATAWRSAPGAVAGDPRRPSRVGALLAVLAVYVLVLDPVGYPIATFLLVLFMLRVQDPHRWPVAFGLAAVAAGGSYLLFAVWLQVPLPAGPFAR